MAGPGQYPFIGGNLLSSDGVRKGEDDYRVMTNEYLVECFRVAYESPEMIKVL